MSEICRETRVIARRCSDPELANVLLHLVDWIEVCEMTIREQKIVIGELRKLEGLRAGHPRGSKFGSRAGRVTPDTIPEEAHVIWVAMGKVKAEA